MTLTCDGQVIVYLDSKCYVYNGMKDAYYSIGITDINPFEIFVSTIPYRFYNIFMIFFVVLTALMSREFGPMYKAEKAAREGKASTKNYNISNLDSQALTPKEGIKLKSANAIVPIFVLIISAVIGFYFNGLSALLPTFLQNLYYLCF